MGVSGTIMELWLHACFLQGIHDANFRLRSALFFHKQQIRELGPLGLVPEFFDP